MDGNIEVSIRDSVLSWTHLVQDLYSRTARRVVPLLGLVHGKVPGCPAGVDSDAPAREGLDRTQLRTSSGSAGYPDLAGGGTGELH